MKIDAKKLPVMLAHCKTCPFKPIEEGRVLNQEVADGVTARTLFQAHQICHGTEKGKKRIPQNRCKGSFDYNYQIYKKMGFEKYIEL